MTEFDYDVRARKQLAWQAKYKKNGSKSRKCTLRQDHMTAAQLRKLNGEVIKFNMNEPIRSWAEFKALSGDSAREYISNLSERYGASIGDFARMFGVTYNPVKTYFQAIGAMAPHGRMPVDKKKAWELFLCGGETEGYGEPGWTDDEPAASDHTEPDEEPVTENETKCGAEQDKGMKMNEFELVFSGMIDLAGVVNSMRVILGASPKGSLRINFSSDSRLPDWL